LLYQLFSLEKAPIELTVLPTPYPIGTPGLPWREAEVAAWLSRQTVKRSYEADVLRVIETLSAR
jgi:predicted DNA-binding transcriptional regulator AlpA